MTSIVVTVDGQQVPVVIRSLGPQGLSAKQIAIAMGEIPADATDEDFFNWLVAQYPLSVTAPSGSVVTTRALLAAIPTPVDGQVAFLTETGRDGMFMFDDGDLSAEVTADPYEGIYVGPDADADGSSGAWVRQHDGRVRAEWFGAAGDGAAADHARINAALAVGDVDLDAAGTYGVEGPVLIPSGRTLRLNGATLIMLAGFASASGVNATVGAVDATRVRVQGPGVVDGNKHANGTGDAFRTNGVMFLRTTDADIDQVYVRNVYGYGIFYQGSRVTGTDYPSSGVATSCRIENCQEYFETMACDGVTTYDLRMESGDGDVDAINFINCLSGTDAPSVNIRHVGAIAVGDANGGFNSTASVGLMHRNIVLEDCRFELTTGGIPLLISGTGLHDRFTARNCEFKSTDAAASYGGNIGDITKSLIEGCTFDTRLVGLGYIRCQLHINDCHFLVTGGSGAAVTGIGQTGAETASRVRIARCRFILTPTAALGYPTSGEAIMVDRESYVSGSDTTSAGTVNNGIRIIDAASSHTLDLWDQEKTISLAWESNNQTLSIPTHAGVPIPVGTRVYIANATANAGASVHQVAAAGGVTLNAVGGLTEIKAYGRAELVQVEEDVWQLSGDLE